MMKLAGALVLTVLMSPLMAVGFVLGFVVVSVTAGYIGFCQFVDEVF